MVLVMQSCLYRGSSSRHGRYEIAFNDNNMHGFAFEVVRLSVW